MAEEERHDRHKVRRFFKARDDYGTPLPLTLNGEDNVTSVWGGIMSL
jgi:hypothetical protein